MATKTLWKIKSLSTGNEIIRVDEVDGDGKIYMDGNEITELSGVTASASELNTLDGITSTTAELNILDGVTATAAELNYNDIASLGTGAASKSVVLDGSGNYATPGSGTLTISSGYTLTIDGTLSGTALPSGDLVGTTASQTLTNKTIALGSNTVSGTTAQFNTALSDGSFATLAGSETLTNKTLTSAVLNTAVSGTAVLDEDNMASDSATQLATQQSIKAYVDANAAGITADETVTLTNKTIDLDSNTITGTAAEFDTALQSDTFVYTSEVGSVVQAYDADTAKTDVAQEYTATQNFNATTLSDGATINWDASANQVASVTLGGNRTMAAPTNLVDGGTYILHVIQDATGSRTITWNAVFKWPGGTAPTLSTGNGDRDIISFVSDGTNMYGVAGLDFS